jgi:nicotinamide-nucleotide amidase
MVEFAARLGRRLQNGGLRIATAESCTGGLVAALITETPGSSAWFEAGFVTYSNAAKVRTLGVSETTLERFGAVSEPVVREMALGALRASPRSQIAISVSGVAGPGGGSPAKPVGTVCFACAIGGSAPASSPLDGKGPAAIWAATLRFPGDRRAVRFFAARAALVLALEGLARRG